MEKNSSRVLLPSATRAANTASPVVNNYDAAYLRLYLNVTMASGSGGLRPVLRGYDKASSNKIELTQGGASAVTATGLFVYEISISNVPSPVFGNIKEAACRPIPFQWDVLVKHADGSSYTYSLSADVTS